MTYARPVNGVADFHGTPQTSFFAGSGCGASPKPWMPAFCTCSPRTYGPASTTSVRSPPPLCFCRNQRCSAIAAPKVPPPTTMKSNGCPGSSLKSLQRKRPWTSLVKEVDCVVMAMRNSDAKGEFVSISTVLDFHAFPTDIRDDCSTAMQARAGSKLAVARYVARCVRREEPPRISELAQELDLTPEHLSRTFRSAHGITLSEFMTVQQVLYAARLLRETNLSATRIAYRCGFGTRRTFFRAFRQRMGRTPEEYRRLMA